VALTWIRADDCEWDADNWRDRAACRDTDPELFFPIGTTGMAIEQIEVAKGICARCETTSQCLTFAFETAQENGVWGGLTEEERKQVRKDWQEERERHAS